MSRVIIVDDDPLFHQLIKAQVAKYAIFGECRCYLDPGSALIDLIDAYYSDNTLPDGIILDLNMPGVDGWQFLGTFDNLHTLVSRQIPVFVVTSSIDPDDFRRAKKYASVKDCFSKPVTPDMLKGIAATLAGLADDRK